MPSKEVLKVTARQYIIPEIRSNLSEDIIIYDIDKFIDTLPGDTNLNNLKKLTEYAKNYK